MRPCLACGARSGGFIQYALEVATKMLPLYERLFKQPFPLPKLDLVGIPDFSAGAMVQASAAYSAFAAQN